VGPECVLCPRIDPLRFLAGCRRRRLNQGLVVALGFFSLLDKACFCVIYSVYGSMLCLLRYLFVISTSVIDCLGRFVPEMTYYVSSGMLNLAPISSFSVLCRKTHTKNNTCSTSMVSMMPRNKCKKKCSLGWVTAHSDQTKIKSFFDQNNWNQQKYRPANQYYPVLALNKMAVWTCHTKARDFQTTKTVTAFISNQHNTAQPTTKESLQCISVHYEMNHITHLKCSLLEANSLHAVSGTMPSHASATSV